MAKVVSRLGSCAKVVVVHSPQLCGFWTQFLKKTEPILFYISLSNKKRGKAFVVPLKKSEEL